MGGTNTVVVIGLLLLIVNPASLAQSVRDNGKNGDQRNDFVMCLKKNRDGFSKLRSALPAFLYKFGVPLVGAAIGGILYGAIGATAGATVGATAAVSAQDEFDKLIEIIENLSDDEWAELLKYLKELFGFVSPGKFSSFYAKPENYQKIIIPTVEILNTWKYDIEIERVIYLSNALLK